jgi:hypothetical protein
VAVVTDGDVVVEGVAVVVDGVVVLEGAAVVVDGASVAGVEIDAHLASKPLASEYTLSTRPLVGTVRSQSGGFSDSTLDSSDTQLSDAHMPTYSSSEGRAVEYRRL